MSSFIGCITLTLYPARHPLPSTTVRHDGRFRFSAGPRRQGQRGRREAQHEEDLRAQGREGFLRPRPGCGCPRGTTHSRRGSPCGSARRLSRASDRARVAANARPRACARLRARVFPFCLVSLGDREAPSAPENLFAFRRRAIARDGRAYPFREARSPRAAQRAVISAARWPASSSRPRARPPRPPRRPRARRVTPGV